VRCAALTPGADNLSTEHKINFRMSLAQHTTPFPFFFARFRNLYIAALAYPLPYCQAGKIPVAGSKGTSLYCNRRLLMVELAPSG